MKKEYPKIWFESDEGSYWWINDTDMVTLELGSILIMDETNAD